MIGRSGLGFPRASMSMFLPLTMLSVSFSFVSYSAVAAEQDRLLKRAWQTSRRNAAESNRVKVASKTVSSSISANF